MAGDNDIDNDVPSKYNYNLDYRCASIPKIVDNFKREYGHDPELFMFEMGLTTGNK